MANTLITKVARHNNALNLFRSNMAFGVYNRKVTQAEVDAIYPSKPDLFAQPYVVYLLRAKKNGDIADPNTKYQNVQYTETDVNDIDADKVLIKSRIVTSHLTVDFTVQSFALFCDVTFTGEFSAEGGYVYAYKVLDSTVNSTGAKLDIIELSLLVDFA